MMSSAPMAVTIARPVRVYVSRIPNDRCATIRIDVISSGGRSRRSMVSGKARTALTVVP